MSTIELTREQWLAERQSGCGASEAAAILGLSPWMTPLEVYLRKTGVMPEKDATPAMKWGLRAQQMIALGYEEETGRTLRDPQKFLRHPEAPWMLATLDYVADDRPVELKRVHPQAAREFGEPGTDQVPEHYRLQCIQQLACSGHDVCDLAALIGHSDFRIYSIPRNDEVIERLIEAEREFMDRVARRDPPLPDFFHSSTLELLNLLEATEGKVIDLPDEIAVLADEYQQLGQTSKQFSDERDLIKAQLIHALDGAEIGWLPDGRRIKRRLTPRAGYTVEPTEFFDFRILKAAANAARK